MWSGDYENEMRELDRKEGRAGVLFTTLIVFALGITLGWGVTTYTKVKPMEAENQTVKELEADVEYLEERNQALEQANSSMLHAMFDSAATLKDAADRIDAYKAIIQFYESAYVPEGHRISVESITELTVDWQEQDEMDALEQNMPEQQDQSPPTPTADPWDPDKKPTPPRKY